MLQDIGKLLIQLNITEHCTALTLISSLFSGIGNDPRENRKFNMIKQGLDYDKEGEYVRLWVEELRGLRGGRAHHPWTLGPGELTGSGQSAASPRRTRTLLHTAAPGIGQEIAVRGVRL